MVKDGVWATMITPFTEANSIDYEGLERMVEWYISHDMDGLFAVCQSSEMFYLSLEERVGMARFIKEKSRDRIPVIASGHISNSLEDQIRELKAMAETGIDVLVLVTNRLAGPDETEETWKQNAEKIMEAVPDIPLGLYECPYPYKRLVSPGLLQWCARTGRFVLAKDTCCNVSQMAEKVEAVKGTGMKLFNANAATLLDSLNAGISGYCGVMANFHPDLYAWMLKNRLKDSEKAQRLQNFLGAASLAECQYYPVNAKYHMQLDGVDITLHTRTREYEKFTDSNRREIQQLHELAAEFRRVWRTGVFA